MNPFEAWSEAEKPHWRQRQERRAAKRKQKLAEVMVEKRQLESRYQLVKLEMREALLRGPHGEPLCELVAYLDGLRPGSGAELVRYIRERFSGAEPELRFEACHLVAAAIASVRESQGLPPFDDPLPWDAKTSAWLKIREVLGD